MREHAGGGGGQDQHNSKCARCRPRRHLIDLPRSEGGGSPTCPATLPREAVMVH